MKLLVLGGTVFLGRHIVDAALARGHEITLFNRGRTRPQMFPGVERLNGDRDGNLDALRGRSWDAAIDTCGYVPRVVRDGVSMLKDAVGHYTFVSSISVYADNSGKNADEAAPVGKLDDPRVEEITPASYGPLKALCEDEVTRAMPASSLIVRPGLLVGPFDPSGRFTYWVRRIADGGDALAPGDPQMQVQFIDTRDASEWMVTCAERRITGVMNMTGPRQPLSMADFLDACRATLNPATRLVWLSEKFLLERNVTPWTEVPLWIPSGDAGVLAVAIDKALAAGLALRPLADTLRDTLAWFRGPEFTPPPAKRLGGGPMPQIGLTAERESELLAAWSERAHAS